MNIYTKPLMHRVKGLGLRCAGLDFMMRLVVTLL